MLPPMLLRVLLGAAVAMVLTPVTVAGASAGSSHAHVARSYHRCATFHDTNSPYNVVGHDEYGVYITRGHVACHAAIRIMTAVFANKAEAIPGSSWGRYHGWYCGGQMGGYFCRNTLRNPMRSFEVTACAAPNLGCPVKSSQVGP
jgi:hypothetical protein